MFSQHWHIANNEFFNNNKELRIEEMKPFPSTRKRKGTRLMAPLLKRAHSDDRLNFGNLGHLGRDNLLNILTRLDANSLFSCLGVNKTLLTLITSPSFRHSWHGNNVVLVGSRTRPWQLLMRGEPKRSPFLPLNSPSSGPRRGHEVVASAAGLLCINIHPTNDILELTVGNPLTQEWLLLPVPEREFSVSSRMSFRMEVFSGGSFKVAAYERAKWLYRVFVYDSGSDSWGVTELHYPPFSSTRWSDYDLTRGRWRTSLISGIGLHIKTGQDYEGTHQLSHPFDQGFCKWEYRSTSYFASLWLGHFEKSFTGYGVWKVDEPSGELVLVSCASCGNLVWDARALDLNDENDIFISCNAYENLVCFMGESPVHPAMPVVVYNIDSRSWRCFESSLEGVSRHDAQVPVKAYDHTSVAIVYSPSLLAPAAAQTQSGKQCDKGLRLGRYGEENSKRLHGEEEKDDDYSRRCRYPSRAFGKEKERDSSPYPSRAFEKEKERRRHRSIESLEDRHQDKHSYNNPPIEEEKHRHYTSYGCSSGRHRRRHESFRNSRNNRDEWRHGSSHSHSRARESRHHREHDRSKYDRWNMEDHKASESNSTTRHQKNSASTTR